MDRLLCTRLVLGCVLLNAATVALVVGAPSEYARGDAYVLPVSGTRVLTDTDLTGLSAAELRLARNEVYARHGCLFQDAALTEYFAEKTWYHPVAGRFATNFDNLSDIERHNVSLIRTHEAYRQLSSAANTEAADADGSAAGVKMMTDEELDRLLGIKPTAKLRPKKRLPIVEADEEENNPARRQARARVPAPTTNVPLRRPTEEELQGGLRPKRKPASAIDPHVAQWLKRQAQAEAGLPPANAHPTAGERPVRGWAPPTPGERAELEREHQNPPPPLTQARVESPDPMTPIRRPVPSDVLAALALGVLGGVAAGVAIAMMLIRRREQKITAQSPNTGDATADPPCTPAEQPLGKPTVVPVTDTVEVPTAAPAGTVAKGADKQCPECGLLSHDSALRCDCGYDFASGTMQESYLPPERRPIRWSTRAWVLSFLFSALGMSAAAGNHLGALFIVLLGWAGGLVGHRIAQAIDTSDKSQGSKSGLTWAAGLGGCLLYFVLFALLAVTLRSGHLSGR